VCLLNYPSIRDRLILLNGWSKTYAMTGWRLGYSVWPPKLYDYARKLAVNSYSCVNAPTQYAGLAALKGPQGDVKKMVAEFDKRRKVVVEGLNKLPGVSCRTPKGAFYAFPNVAGACETLGGFEAHRRLPDGIRGRTSPATLFQMFLLFRHHVATMDRRSFGVIGSEGRHYLRLSIATGLDDLKDALVRIATATHEPDGFAAFVRDGRHLA
jgi:aspartate/methionine/tyrosine aminotransferase